MPLRLPVVPSPGDEQLVVSPDLHARRARVFQGKSFDRIAQNLQRDVNVSEARNETDRHWRIGCSLVLWR